MENDWTVQSIITIVVGLAATAGLFAALLWTMANSPKDDD
jgi:hypothetical protein